MITRHLERLPQRAVCVCVCVRERRGGGGGFVSVRACESHSQVIEMALFQKEHEKCGKVLLGAQFNLNVSASVWFV